jgi:electron transfer flavoprotein beta subunit
VQGLLRGNAKDRAAFYGAGITDGWMTRNEARALEDLNPIDGLDTPLRPLNMTPGDRAEDEIDDDMDDAARVDDPALNAHDSLAYATAAAAATKKVDGAQLVIFGRESVDVATDQHAYQTARKLGWTMVSYVSKILALDPAAGTIKVEKLLENGKQVVTAKLPAVLTVMKEINEPRYPSFMGIRKANKAVIPVWSLADLGVSAPAASIGDVAYKPLPAREVHTEFIEGDADEMAAKLVEKLIEEKVL